MKIACWNIRGFHKPLKQRSVRSLLGAHKIDIFGILESKFDKKDLDSLMRIRFPGMQVINNFDSNSRGRILVIWNPASVDLEVMSMESQCVHVRVTCLRTAKVFCASFIYGLNKIVQRRMLWDNLKQVGSTIKDPWVLMGDFNNVLSQEDKKGGLEVKNYETREFLDCVGQLDLTDMRSIGCFFTWMSNAVCCKLDRVMINPEWMNASYEGVAEFLAPGCVSDHTLSVVSLLETRFAKKKPFKFFNMWALSERFSGIVADKWSYSGVGTAQFRLKQILNKLKGPLTNLNHTQFSHISSRASKAKRELVLVQNLALETGIIDYEYKEIKKRTEMILEAERLFLTQKTKCTYIKYGDRCSKFFYDLIKRNNKRNAIVALQDSNGNLCADQEQIADVFLGFYKDLLGAKQERTPIVLEELQAGTCVDTSDGEGLTRSVTDEEIKEALFDIDIDKAPGPDGYGSMFFKSSWSIVGKDFCCAIREFFINGKLLKQWNHASIALVPKSSHASSVNDYRPISCCTVFYKVISKILVNRMRSVVGKLVDGAQAAFIQGRSIVDNIHLAQELLRKYARKRISPRCILKVDLTKAYDTVDWEFLREVLVGLNFPTTFVRWVMECVTTASYSISINGRLHGMFIGQRGLRQGDPLSPLLFTLCLEVLSRSLKTMSRSPLFSYHPMCQNLHITHLAYADDLLLLSRGDTRSVGMLISCLNRFGDTAGPRVNLLKSNIYMAGIDDTTRQSILDISGFVNGQLPFRYLGIPLASRKLKTSDYSMLVDNIAERINSWPRHSLSQAGKIELIRTVLQGVECFWMSILPLPANIIHDIYSLCRKFVWPTKHPPIAWNTLCKPIDDGGMGVKNLVAWNNALIAKTLWKIHMKEDSLWIKWVSHSHCNFGNIWNWQWHKEESPLIKQLLRIRDDMVTRQGSIDGATALLESWFSNGKGLGKAYEFFIGAVGRWPWKPIIWKSCILPKHRFILWMVAHGKLMTRDRQSYVEDKECVLCKRANESVDHLFFKCKVATELWNTIREWLGMEKIMGTVGAVLRAFRGVYRGSNMLSKTRIVALAASVYQIWNFRNRALFENEVPDIARAVMKIKILTMRCTS